jgi:hypothetical protein
MEAAAAVGDKVRRRGGVWVVVVVVVGVVRFLGGDWAIRRGGRGGGGAVPRRGGVAGHVDARGGRAAAAWSPWRRCAAPAPTLARSGAAYAMSRCGHSSITGGAESRCKAQSSETSTGRGGWRSLAISGGSRPPQHATCGCEARRQRRRIGTLTGLRGEWRSGSPGVGGWWRTLFGCDQPDQAIVRLFDFVFQRLGEIIGDVLPR